MSKKNCDLVSKIVIGLIIAGVIISTGCIVLGIVKNNSKMLYVLGVLGFLAVGCLVFLEVIIKKISKMDDYDRNLYIIFKLNNGILVNGESASEVREEDLVAVNSFKDLLKVQSSVSMPIVYKKTDDSCKFSIKAGKYEYRYILKK